MSAVDRGEQQVLSLQCPHKPYCADTTRWGNDRYLEQMRTWEFHKFWHFNKY